MKKLISLLLAVVLVATLCVPFTVSAADDVISSEVVKSITDGEDPEVGLGVAFLYTMNMTETQHHSIRSFVSAKVGEAKVVKLGAIVSNHEETGKNPEAMIIENANGQKLLNVEATKLWGWDETGLSYAVRITNIPEANKKTQIYARPYYVLEDGTVVYGDIANKSYFSGWCDAQDPVELPAIGTDIDVTKKKNRIRVSAAGSPRRPTTCATPAMTPRVTFWTLISTARLSTAPSTSAASTLRRIRSSPSPSTCRTTPPRCD